MDYRVQLALGLAAITAASLVRAEAHHRHWSYSGMEGPGHWAELVHQFAACSAGKSQSPIDIRTGAARREALPALEFSYAPSALHIVDNGHTVQVKVDPGSFLTVAGDRYELVQFHFHHPSEERLDGKGTDMVAHLVHRNSNGKLAVVAVPLISGKPNAMVETLWQHLPNRKEIESTPNGVRINPGALIPPNHSYFAYAGSLTTPPCTEGVRWIVLKSPQTLSEPEIATFASLYPNNARPVQMLHGREVLARP